MPIGRLRIRRPSENWGPEFFINAVHAFNWRENSRKPQQNLLTPIPLDPSFRWGDAVL